MNKNLLIVAYYFPPSGGPGVQRVLKHVRYLPEFGWNPIVLTVSNGDFPARDESLLKEIPVGLQVERTHIYEPYDLYRLLTGKKKGTAIDVNVIKKEGQKSGFKDQLAEFIRATFFIPDARIGWMISAPKAIDNLVKSTGIDAVYSSSPPYTCSIIARYAKRKYKLPWVAGFRDPWTGFISSPNRWILPSMIDRAMEKSVFKEADQIECAWKGIIKDALSKYPDIDPNKFHHVPNGFDSADYPVTSSQRNNRFTITYTGSMYGRRNPSSLFEAIEKLLLNNRISKEEFLLRFIGRFGNEVHEMFDKSSFRDSIELISYIPHSESIEYLMRSDVLLLVVDESKESEEIVPGKVYEYIGTRIPVFAIAPEHSAIAELMEETKAGSVAHQTNVEKIGEIFMNYFNQWKFQTSEFKPNVTAVNAYERKESARKLSLLLNSLVQK